MDLINTLTLLVSVVTLCLTIMFFELDKPKIQRVRYLNRGDFICICLDIRPGDKTAEIETISIKGFKLAKARVQAPLYEPNSLRMEDWLPPSEAELREEFTFNVLLSPSGRVLSLTLVCVPETSSPVREMTIKVSCASFLQSFRKKVTIK